MESFNLTAGATAGLPQNPMERVLYNLHHRLCTTALQWTTRKGRTLAERFFFFIFLTGFGVTMIAHISFVHRDTTSLDGRPLQSIPLTCLSSISGFSTDADVTHISLLNDENATSWAYLLGETESCPNIPPDEIYFSHSKVQGYLLLSPKVCAQHHLKVQHVAVSMVDENCFGGPILQTITRLFTGADTAALNWVLGAFNSSGFIYNPRTKNMLDISHYSHPSNEQNAHRWYQQIQSKTGVVIKTSFLFFIVTTLVSFILRETQERMLEFTHQLQSRVRLGQRVGQLVVKHLVENLVFVPIQVGIIFFLIEIYRGDKVTAFMVLSIVWVCEAFSVISLRSSQGMHFFPRIFFLEYSMFHFYLFMFPFGFTYIALASTAFCMIHTMLFFWHRYELPALAHGHITVDHPRMGGSPSRRGSSDRPPEIHRSGSIPRLPNVRITRSVSRNSVTSSQGGARNNSRHSSTLALFHQGDEDDDASSYMFLMDGEVVIHGGMRSPTVPSDSAEGDSSTPRIPESISTRIDGERISAEEPSVSEEEALPMNTSNEGGRSNVESPVPAESAEFSTPRVGNRASDVSYVGSDGGSHIPLPDLPDEAVPADRSNGGEDLTLFSTPLIDNRADVSLVGVAGEHPTFPDLPDDDRE